MNNKLSLLNNPVLLKCLIFFDPQFVSYFLTNIFTCPFHCNKNRNQKGRKNKNNNNNNNYNINTLKKKKKKNPDSFFLELQEVQLFGKMVEKEVSSTKRTLYFKKEKPISLPLEKSCSTDKIQTNISLVRHILVSYLLLQKHGLE